MQSGLAADEFGSAEEDHDSLHPLLAEPSGWRDCWGWSRYPLTAGNGRAYGYEVVVSPAHESPDSNAFWSSPPASIAWSCWNAVETWSPISTSEVPIVEAAVTSAGGAGCVVHRVVDLLQARLEIRCELVDRVLRLPDRSPCRASRGRSGRRPASGSARMSSPAVSDALFRRVVPDPLARVRDRVVPGDERLADAVRPVVCRGRRALRSRSAGRLLLPPPHPAATIAAERSGRRGVSACQAC